MLKQRKGTGIIKELVSDKIKGFNSISKAKKSYYSRENYASNLLENDKHLEAPGLAYFPVAQHTADPTYDQVYLITKQLAKRETIE